MNNISYIIQVKRNRMKSFVSIYGYLSNFYFEAKRYKSLSWAIKRYNEFKNYGYEDVKILKDDSDETYITYIKEEVDVEKIILQRKIKLI